ncbi:unnamed protein product [Allacma fusca]|uniref:Uncharacterized protein n=1 Tax=Allacma fusca TaxID=39272 RepID=A0A8J2L4H1_9HEXA|nr:unnamed protein product [Allacma fusca]
MSKTELLPVESPQVEIPVWSSSSYAELQVWSVQAQPGTMGFVRENSKAVEEEGSGKDFTCWEAGVSTHSSGKAGL